LQSLFSSNTSLIPTVLNSAVAGSPITAGLKVCDVEIFVYRKVVGHMMWIK
jgi:hypothetical protein